jgi:dihydrodipicolinate synthase/N-acetylneuraminate lyase
MAISAERRAQVSKRLFVALVLPQTSDFQIDEAGVRRHVRYYMNHRFAKAGGFIVNPEAGEIYYMSREEKRRVLDIVLEEAGGKVPVFAGSFGMTTPETIQVARDAKAAGADGLFVIPPAGCMDVSVVWDPIKYPEVWLNQIKDQNDAVDLPMITHPVVSPSPKFGIGLPLETTLKFCAEVPNIVGWKMTYHYNGNRVMCRNLRKYAPQVAILQASAWLFHEFLANEYLDGTVSGSWNFAMEPMLDHIEAWRRADVAKAREIWNAGLGELQEYVYSEPARLHVRYKIATYLRGLIPSPLPRLPMPAPRPEEMETLRKLLVKANLQVIPEAKQAFA